MPTTLPSACALNGSSDWTRPGALIPQVAMTLIMVVTVSMASAAQSPKDSGGKVAPQPGIVVPAEGVRLDPAALADIQTRLSSAIGAPGDPLGVSELSATPVIEDSIRYWTDGRNPATLLDISKLTLAITEVGRLSILIDFNPVFDKLGVGTTDSLWILLDTDNNTETGTNFGGLMGFDNIVVFRELQWLAGQGLQNPRRDPVDHRDVMDRHSQRQLRECRDT
jgi:hypothetical protein